MCTEGSHRCIAWMDKTLALLSFSELNVPVSIEQLAGKLASAIRESTTKVFPEDHCPL
jgi:hypothetical protein